jgi:hypothetical protein
MNDLTPLFIQSEWITKAEAREASEKSESSVKRLQVIPKYHQFVTRHVTN